MQNLLPFNLEDLKQYTFCLNTKPKSLALGRRLYDFSVDGQKYWLKGQVHAMQNVALYKSFENELNFYKHSQNEPFLQNIHLPFQIIENEMGCIDEVVLSKVLILPHTTAVFADAASMFSKEQVVHIILQLLTVLEQLQETQWIHGDLKPEHFRWFNGHIRLIDFEQTYLLKDPCAVMTATPRYMAPELFNGQKKSIESEIYALGIILYEWLTGRRIDVKSYLDWAYFHCQNFEMTLTSNFQDLGPWLSKALVRQQHRRFHSFKEMRNELIDGFV